MRRPRVLTWHIHGSYLYYLAHARAEFYLPMKPGRPEGYGARNGDFTWPENVHEVRAEDVANLELDCVLFQSRKNYLVDQFEILSPAQRELPRIFLEHDPPREDPSGTLHTVDNPDVLLVHVTAFNDLMWESRRTPTRVIEHGVTDPGYRYDGSLARGITVVNNLGARGRRLGRDIFERAGAKFPLDLVGMGSEELGGMGNVPQRELPALEARYRLFFNPIRYTSLGLAICEAMMLGMPIVGLATTELVTVIENGRNGYIDTRLDRLIAAMQDLAREPALARELGAGARRTALERFSISRFAADWEAAFAEVTGGTRQVSPAAVPEAAAAGGGG